MRILIAEDERAAAQAMAKFLQLKGHIVRVALDGPAALEAAGALCPEVLIADWRLGHDMDGIELARALKQRLPGLLTVLISAYPPASLEAAAEGLEDAVLMSKPMRLCDLAEVVEASADHEKH